MGFWGLVAPGDIGTWIVSGLEHRALGLYWRQFGFEFAGPWHGGSGVFQIVAVVVVSHEAHVHA